MAKTNAGADENMIGEWIHYRFIAQHQDTRLCASSQKDGWHTSVSCTETTKLSFSTVALYL